MGLKLRNVLLPTIPFAATVCGGLVPAEPGLAQQSLCNPCVDPPLPSARRQELAAPSATSVIGPEEMRALGVVGVADLVGQPGADPASLVDDCRQPVIASFAGLDWGVSACLSGIGQAALLIAPAEGNASLATFVFVPAGNRYELLFRQSERSPALSELRGLSTGDVRELFDRAQQAGQAESGNGSVVQ